MDESRKARSGLVVAARELSLVVHERGRVRHPIPPLLHSPIRYSGSRFDFHLEFSFEIEIDIAFSLPTTDPRPSVRQPSEPTQSGSQ